MKDIYQQVALIVVAAGEGARFGGPKQLAILNGRPLLVHTLEAFDSCDFLSKTVVLPENWLGEKGHWQQLTDSYDFLRTWETVEGGNTRSGSVANGVNASDVNAPLLAVHDGARPFVPIMALEKCILLLHQIKEAAGAIVTAPVTDTIKVVQTGEPVKVVETLKREKLRRAETPQVIRRAAFDQAMDTLELDRITDEAGMLEMLGKRCLFVDHAGWNLKITHPDDIRLAQAFLNCNRRK